MKHFGIEENIRFSEMAKAVRTRRESEEQQHEETARMRHDLVRASLEETRTLLLHAKQVLESGPPLVGTPRAQIWARIVDALDLIDRERHTVRPVP